MKVQYLVPALFQLACMAEAEPQSDASNPADTAHDEFLAEDVTESEQRDPDEVVPIYTGCEDELTATTLIFQNLDGGSPKVSKALEVAASTNFVSTAEAVEAVSWSGPIGTLAYQETIADLERWEARPYDYGGIVWVSSALNSVLISGSTYWGSGPPTPVSEDPSIQFNATGVTIEVELAVSMYYRDELAIANVFIEKGLRSVSAARYAACGSTFLAYVHAPWAPVTNADTAVGIFMMVGHRGIEDDR